MAKDININSAEWCELVFEGKNKSYGAYRMRQTSGKRHRNAFIIIVLFVTFIGFLPTLIKKIEELRPKHEALVETREMQNLKLEDQLKQENIVERSEAEPPPPLKSTIKFTVPEITDQPIEEGQELRSQDEIAASKVQISVADVKGNDEEHGVDIADLEEHQVIVEEKPLNSVEQMPQFPGGEEELLKFISGNLRYPSVAQEVGIEGRVIVRFVVSKNGDVEDVQVIRSLDPACDKEAIRVVKMMPKWIPGRQNGRNVPVYYTIPIVYRLQK
ncbi:MAG: TonB family protein [Bacteroidota bacterium]|nr:TonB family protein [Bacteroidota bacterium]